MSGRPALAALALVAGCQFDGGLGDGLLCPTGECPAGQLCREGVCSAGEATSDAGLPSDGGGGQGDAAGLLDAGLGVNLVANPGMEIGIDPWTAYNAALNEHGEPHGGQKSLAVCNAELTGDFTVYQDVLKAPDEQIPQGQSYAASIWVHAVSTAVPGKVRLTIRESGGATERADHDGTTTTVPGDSWIKLQASGTVQESDRENLILIVWGLESQTGDCFAVDDALLRTE